MSRAIAPEGDRSRMPRAVVLFAHYDDEVIAIGARLRRFAKAFWVHITDSAPRNEEDAQAHGFASLAAYRAAREKEFRTALNSAGFSNVNHECLGIPDQEASLRLSELTFRISRILDEYEPEIIFTHPYEGGHPDHDACAFGVHQAVSLKKKQNKSAPLIIEAAFYHSGANGIETGSFLPTDPRTKEVFFGLSPEERRRKETLLACFATQQETLKYFSAEHERFRIAPRYNFQKPPHAPPVFYDSYPWGMDSHRFCQLAQEAEQSMLQGISISTR
jgi:LmbE family N-acetylglucosaminyl deacetylase